MNLRRLAFGALIVAVLVLPAAVEAYKLWSGEYPGEIRDWFRAATFISGGDWIIVGENYRSTHNVNENLRMIRIDETGEVVWDKKIVGDSPDASRRDVLRGVAPSPDGGWVTAGDLQMSAGLGDSDAWVAKWDRYGDLVWSQLIGTAGQEDGFQVVASPAGGYFLYGRTAEDYGAVVVKLDEDGAIVWAKHFDDVSISLDTSSIAATADGGCVFVAWDPPSVEPQFHRNLVVKLDQDGVPDWMKEIGGTSLSDVTLRSVAPHPDGYVLVGEMNLRPWLVKVNSDGSEATQYRVKMFQPGPPPTGEVQISEIRTWPDSEEYFELSGTPGTSLDDLTYLVIGDALSFHVRCEPAGSGVPPGCCEPDPFDCWCFEDVYPNGCRLNSGVIEEVVDLSGQTIPDSGFFVAAEAGFGLGPATLTTPLNFEDDDNVTHLLVRDFTGALDDDLDTNDDGPPLEATPWAETIDQIALIEETNQPYGTEWYYSTTPLGPDGGQRSPVHAYLANSGWEIGSRDFSYGDDTAGLSNGLVFDDARGWDVIVADDGVIWNGPTGTTNWFLKTDLSDPQTVLWEREFLEPYRDSIATDLVLGPDDTFVGVGKTLGWDSWMVRARVSDGMAAATCTTGTRSAIVEEADFFGWLDSDVVVSNAALQVLDVLDWVAIDIQDINQPDMLYCLEINGEVVILFEGFENGTYGDWDTVVP